MTTGPELLNRKSFTFFSKFDEDTLSYHWCQYAEISKITQKRGHGLISNMFLVMMYCDGEWMDKKLESSCWFLRWVYRTIVMMSREIVTFISGSCLCKRAINWCVYARPRGKYQFKFDSSVPLIALTQALWLRSCNPGRQSVLTFFSLILQLRGSKQSL